MTSVIFSAPFDSPQVNASFASWQSPFGLSEYCTRSIEWSYFAETHVAAQMDSLPSKRGAGRHSALPSTIMFSLCWGVCPKFLLKLFSKKNFSVTVAQHDHHTHQRLDKRRYSSPPPNRHTLDDTIRANPLIFPSSLRSADHWGGTNIGLNPRRRERERTRSISVYVV
jgi:hypothetical protein